MGKGFAADLKAFVNKNDIRSEKFYRRLSVAGLAGVIRVSPFDTHAFEQDWAVTVGDQDNAKVNPYMITVNNDIYIRNTKAYAEKLEHGHSEQAKHGIVRVVAKELKFNIEAGRYNDR